MQNLGKPLCVIDQCSIRFLCEVDLERMSLIKWLTMLFRTYVPTDLFDQTYEALRNVETRELLNSEVDANNIIKTETSKDCFRVITKESELGKKRYSEYSEADEGELKCAAVALELSRKYPDAPVYLLTDDLRARSIINYIFQKQQIGTTLSSLDFLIYVFVREESIGVKFAQNALRDLMSVLKPGTKRRLYYWPQQYENFLQESCRSLCNKCYNP